MATKYSLRKVEVGDTDFLFKAYASTRKDIEDIHEWTYEQKSQILRMQFDAQQTDYTTRFPNANFCIAHDHALMPIGRFYINQTLDEYRIIDITILPAFQKIGYGTAMMKDAMRNAADLEIPVRLRVAKDNRALHWYFKLGFEVLDEIDFCVHMEWDRFASAIGLQQH